MKVVQRSQKIVNYGLKVVFREVADVTVEHASEALVDEVHHQENGLEFVVIHLIFWNNNINQSDSEMVGLVL